MGNGYSEPEFFVGDVWIHPHRPHPHLPRQNWAVVRELLCAWEEIAEVAPPTSLNVDRNFLLRLAVMSGDVAKVKAMLAWTGSKKQYFDPTEKNDAAANLATWLGHVDIVKLFLAWVGPEGSRVDAAKLLSYDQSCFGTGLVGKPLQKERRIMTNAIESFIEFETPNGKYFCGAGARATPGAEAGAGAGSGAGKGARKCIEKGANVPRKRARLSPDEDLS